MRRGAALCGSVGGLARMDRPDSGKRAHIDSIIQDVLSAVEPAACVRRALSLDGAALRVAERTYDLDAFNRILVLGAGKGSAAMAAGLEHLLGERITGGHVTVKYGYGRALGRITVGEAGHPVPDQNGLREAQKALQIASDTGDGDLVFCLISGGGSALWPAPAEEMSLDDKQAVTSRLLACGASIDEINAVRKHISRIKGGRLAAALAPATVVGLLLSDVVGDRLDVIASGPTCGDPSTFADAAAVLHKYDLEGRIPASVGGYIQEGVAGRRPETPRPDDELFVRVQNLVVGSNRQALEAAAAAARQAGYRAEIITSAQTGDTADHAARIAERLKVIPRDASEGRCLLWGGETTLMLPDDPGQGGRNQHMALLMAQVLEGRDDAVFASVGTDGTDGPTDAAGGIVDGESVRRGRDKGLDIKRALKDCDSYSYLKSTGDVLVTGPTGTNVMDVQILLVGSPSA
jgi:glycerate 2-kinase